MRKWHTSPLVPALLLALFTPGPVVGQDARCGSYCLYVALKALGLGPVSFEELEQRLGDPDHGGYTMEQLDQAARAMGARTIAVRTTLENLAARPESFTCIALINGSHFVLLYNADRRIVRFCDPPTLKDMPASTFRSVWSGEALLIGTSSFLPEEEIERSRRRTALLVSLAWVAGLALVVLLLALAARSFVRRRAAALAFFFLFAPLGCSPPSPAARPDTSPNPPVQPTTIEPGLRAVPPQVDLGVVHLERPNQTIVAKALLKNDGPRTLTVETIIPNCACTSVRVDPLTIKPGATAKLEATIRVANSSEDAATQVLIHTSDKRNKPLPVVFTWKPRNPLFVESPQLTQRAVRPGQSTSQTIRLRLVGLSLCADCGFDVHSSHPGLSHRLELASLPRQGHAVSAPERDIHAGDLSVGTQATEDEASERGLLVVSLRCGEIERARLDLPITWMVVPAIGAAPRRLFLGTGPPGQLIRRKVTLSAATGEPFRIGSVTTESGKLRLTVPDQPVEPRPVHVLELRLTIPRSGGAWTDNILIQTDLTEQPTVVIPVAGVAAD